ncbi:MAG: hypothetical protein J6M65_08670 [Eubacterium sp.]|nr:hypothetical protein [Eubacterium sp.]
MELAAIFSDNMVLQRDVNVRIFGCSDRTEKITIDIDNIHVSRTVDAGDWEIILDSHAVGGPYDMRITAESGDKAEEKIIRNVLYGEVWMTNGQSNIEFELQNSLGGPKEIEQADYPDIRYFKCIKSPVVDEEFLEKEKHLNWHQVKGGDFREISGISYFFSQKMHQMLKIPIGIVDCYQGGTSITCWLEKERLENIPEAEEYLVDFEKETSGRSESEYERLLEDYNCLVQKHLSLTAEAKAKNPDITPDELEEVAGSYPWPPPLGLRSAFRPGGLVETMFKRVSSYTMRGLIYYQGEEDTLRNLKYYKETGQNLRYEVLLYELIKEYRELTGRNNLPIVVVQLPMYMARHEEDLRDWAYLRDAQESVSEKMNDVILVPIIDTGEYGNVHPVDKKSPALRIASKVLADIYGMESEGARDMCLASYERKGESIILSFADTYGEIRTGENELQNIREETSEEGHLYGFEIVLEGGKSMIPEAVIDGENIVIRSREDAISLSYAHFNYGKVNIYNKRGMPLRPFKVLLK